MMVNLTQPYCESVKFSFDIHNIFLKSILIDSSTYMSRASCLAMDWVNIQFPATAEGIIFYHNLKYSEHTPFPIQPELGTSLPKRA
jgi:hypothetical protein